jgi:hypothetical protein
MLRDPARMEIHDGDRALPVQTRVTAQWPDGSVRWLLVRSLVDLPGNTGKQVGWRISGRASGKPGVEVRRAPDGSLEVSTGALTARIPASGFFPLADVRYRGQPFTGRMQGFVLRAGQRRWSTAEAGPVKIEVREEGPVAAVVRVSGKNGGADSPFDFSAELTFWAGKPYVAVDYRALLARGPKEQAVDAWEWSAAAAEPALRVREGHGHYGLSLRESPEQVAYSFGPDEFRFDAVEHEFQSYWGDFWFDWNGPGAGLAVTLRQAQQNFPKAMEASARSMLLGLYPAGKEPLRFPLGAAKSHQMLLHFHAPDLSVAEISARSLQFQIPDVAKLDSAWYAQSRVWDDPIFEAPPCRRIDALLYDVLDNRPVGMGIWNFGDEAEWGYTGQGRGRDDIVWLNNEYDFTHHLTLHYARTGERRFLDYAFATGRHWRDVDIAHVSDRPLIQGGHIAHSPRHVTGGVGPSHQWVEGLFDAWHVFGDEDARAAALGVGENILRHVARPESLDPARSSTRDMGWALRALLALYRETNDRRYLEAARPIVRLFERWHAEHPGLLSPYTDHSQVRVVFMNSLTLASLARYYRYVPGEPLKKLILAETDDLIRYGRNRNGLFYYKELPSLQRQGSTVMILQLLGEAFRLSGDRRYLQAGLPDLEHFLRTLDGRFLIHGGAAEKFAHPGGGYSRTLYYPHGGKSLGTAFGPIFEFLDAAKDTGLARNLDWRLALE